MNILNISVLKGKGILWIDVGAHKTPVGVTKESAFGEAYFSAIYSGVNIQWYRKSWKEFR